MTGKSKTCEQRINCYRCHYFYITWDRQFPRGCRAYNFKSAALPSVIVQQSSGTSCLKFRAKQT